MTRSPQLTTESSVDKSGAGLSLAADLCVCKSHLLSLSPVAWVTTLLHSLGNTISHLRRSLSPFSFESETYSLSAECSELPPATVFTTARARGGVTDHHYYHHQADLARGVAARSRYARSRYSHTSTTDHHHVHCSRLNTPSMRNTTRVHGCARACPFAPSNNDCHLSLKTARILTKTPGLPSRVALPLGCPSSHKQYAFSGPPYPGHLFLCSPCFSPHFLTDLCRATLHVLQD